MTREEFIKKLNKGYSYKLEGDKIVVTDGGSVALGSLTSIPTGVEFKNGGDVYLGSLETLPLGVEFKNGGSVYLRSLTYITPGVEFNNRAGVYLSPIEWFNEWEGSIEGIDSKRLLNVMIKQGVFER